MRSFRIPSTIFLAIALCLAAVSARAADLVVVNGAPALLYKFGTFERHGVYLADGGSFLVRQDGCFESDMAVVNPTGYNASVSVAIRFSTPRGRHYRTESLVTPTVLSPGTMLIVDTAGCDPALAAAFPTLQRYGIARIFSVR